MSEQTWSARLFDGRAAEHELEEWLEEKLGELSFDHLTWDDYDSSLELKGCTPELRLNDDVLTRLWEHGFSRCWLCHIDNWETYYYRSGEMSGHRKQVKS